MDNILQNAIFASIIASVIFYWMVQFIQFSISQFKYRHLKGEYEVYRKYKIDDDNGIRKTVFEKEEAKVIITKVRGSIIHILYQSKNASAAKGLIKMSSTRPNYGEGSYSHFWIENGWGTLIVQLSYNKKDFLINTRYVQTDGKALYYAYHWKRITD